MNIHVIRENSLNIPRGLYTSWMGNELPTLTETTLISEGAAIVTNVVEHTTDAQIVMSGDVIQGIINPKTGLIEPLNKVFQKSAIPVIIPPSGAGSSISAGGVVTLVAALSTTYSACWMLFPAGAVVGDALGGLYYVQMTSTTQGNVYTNGKTGDATGATSDFTPYIPSGTLVLAVGSGATFTHPLSTQLTLTRKMLLGGSLGNNGSIVTTQHWNWSSATSNKTIRTRLGATNMFDADNGSVTNNGYYLQNMISNRGAPNLQVTNPGFQVFSRTVTGFAQRYTTVDTAVDQAVTLTGSIATITDWIVLEQFITEVFQQS